MSGWLKIHRKIREWEWYSDANTFRLFMHLLLEANFEEKKWMGETIKRGELVSSRDHIAKALKLTTQQIRTSEGKLLSTGSLIVNSTNKFTKYIIVNYEDYNGCDVDDNKQITNEQQTDNKQITTTKELKKERIKEEDLSKGIPTDLFPDATLPSFIPENLWEAFKLMRKGKGRGKQLTPLAEQLHIKTLKGFKDAGEDIVKIMEYTLMGAYDRFYSLNDRNKQTTGKVDKHGNFEQQDYRAGVKESGFKTGF